MKSDLQPIIVITSLSLGNHVFSEVGEVIYISPCVNLLAEFPNTCHICCKERNCPLHQLCCTKNNNSVQQFIGTSKGPSNIMNLHAVGANR